MIKLIQAKNKSKQWANGRGDKEGSPQFFVTIIQNIKNQYNQKNFNQKNNKKTIQTTIIKGQQLLTQNFRLLHAVGRGSSNQPILANITYNGNPQSDKYIAFIGKGVCFDAGGLDIKTPDAMKKMYLDKQGACTVLAAFQSIVKQQININLTCSIGLVQNVIGSKSYRPGDIIKSRKGYNIKIQDTDAEGRLILADAMHWTQQSYKIQLIIQLSTLTYSNIAALGHKYTGLFTNHQQTAMVLKNFGNLIHQYVWHMPLDKQHFQILQSQQADFLNDLVDGVPGGSIAAAFLQKFVQKNVKWVHLDIGGTGIIQNKGTGWGTILLIQYIKKMMYKQN